MIYFIRMLYVISVMAIYCTEIYKKPFEEI